MVPPRTEEDSLGSREVPENAYWGIQTLRARENFPVSGLRSSRHLVRAYALLKLACCRANVAAGGLDAERGRAIGRAAEEMADGKFDGEFPIDVFQAGAGTSFHMNVNEVLANRALEILGKPRGSYREVSPNDHVNRGHRVDHGPGGVDGVRAPRPIFGEGEASGLSRRGRGGPPRKMGSTALVREA